jgi:hypothetical protein
MYIGYAISLATAFNIFDYKESLEDSWAQEYRYHMLRDHLVKHDLDLYFYDKNVYILGKRVGEFHAGNDTHYLVNDAIELMITYKHKVTTALKAAGANLAEFDIEVMEGEPTKVQNPPPYLIT